MYNVADIFLFSIVSINWVLWMNCVYQSVEAKGLLSHPCEDHLVQLILHPDILRFH
jgi:hypothetical protein